MKNLNYQSYEAYQQTFNVPTLTTSLLTTQFTTPTPQFEQQHQQYHCSAFSTHGLNYQQYRNLYNNTNNSGSHLQQMHQQLLQKQQSYTQMNYYQQLQLQQQNQQQQDQQPQEYLKNIKLNTLSTNSGNNTSSKSQQLSALSNTMPMESSVNSLSQVYDNYYCGNFDRMAKSNLNLSFLQKNIKNNEHVNNENHQNFNDVTLCENQYYEHQQREPQQNCSHIQQQQTQLNMEQLQRHIKRQNLQLQLQKNALQQQQQVQNQKLYETCLSEQNFDVQTKDNDCKFSLNACEISNFLANELFVQQLATVDGMQSGVPTLTTSTLTPTTLRSIEETFIQLTSEPVNAPYQAGFIPPPLATYPSASSTPATSGFNGNIQELTDANPETDSEDSQNSWNAAQINEENSLATTDTSSAATDSTSFQNGLSGLVNSNLNATSNAVTNDFNITMAAISAAAKNLVTSTPTTRRNQGGRRPTKPSNLTPEEEEKRRVRRERNKLAAARCRKRRVDQTNELLEEVAQLEKKRDGLNKDIENLNRAKQELEYLLEAHRPTCQKIRDDLLSVNTFGGLIVPATSTDTNSNDSSSGNITGLDTTLASTGRSASPIDLKPIIMQDAILHIKNEPLDSTLDSNSSLDHDGPPSPKRMLLTSNNPMIPPPLPNVATLTASLAAASASLNTPIMTVAPVNFAAFSTSNNNTTLNALNAKSSNNGGKQRPNSLPTMPRNSNQNLGLNVNSKLPTDINGVAIQTPSTGMFNFDSLMDGGTGLTPVSGPLVPNCSSQNKHPLELATPTSEPSKLVSL